LEAGKNLAAWVAAKGSEVSFWREWLATKGFAWPEDYEPRLNPEQPLQDRVIRHLSAPPGATVSILDVGAGPLTKLGKRWEGRTILITAVDPLADQYKQLLAAAGIKAPVETEPGEVERLTERFPTNHFDLVNMENALDHSYDPLLGLEQMLEVVKPGGYVLLLHDVNEGHRTGYSGFHQWNFCADDDHFVVWNRKTRFSVNGALGAIAETSVELWNEDIESVPGAYGPIPYEGKIFVSLRKKK
jgi:SAM-dependent methyltransferase